MKNLPDNVIRLFENTPENRIVEGAVKGRGERPLTQVRMDVIADAFLYYKLVSPDYGIASRLLEYLDLASVTGPYADLPADLAEAVHQANPLALMDFLNARD